MGNSESRPSDCSDQPWWSIENETFLLNQPNLSEIYAAICEPEEIKYPTVREKILAKLRDRKYSASSDSEDQSLGENHENYVVNKKNKDDENTNTSSCSESEPGMRTTPQTLEEFREELRMKRMARQGALNDLRSELNTLRQQLAEERELNRRLRNGEEIVIERKEIAIGTDDEENAEKESIQERQRTKSESQDTGVQTDAFSRGCVAGDPNQIEITRSPSGTQQINLKAQLAELQLSLQLANADNLSLTTELGVVKKQVASLKEVIACSRQMIEVREEQVQQVERKRNLG